MAAFWCLVTYFFWFVWANALNIPYHDGIFDFLAFLINVETAESLPEALAHWWAQYNDHRTSATRIQVYLAYLAQGELNFHTLALLANLSLPLVLFMLYLAAKASPYRWVFLLSSALLLLHIRTFSIVLWNQPAFAYCYVFTYAFACLFALHRVTPTRFVIGALFCMLASLTLAAAQTVWLFGLVSLAHQSLFNEKRSWRYPVAWALTAVIGLAVWHHGFVGIEQDDWSNQNPEDLMAAFPGLLIDPTFSELVARCGSFFLVMLGSAFTDQSTYLAGTAGALLLGLLIYISLVGMFRDDQRLTLCCWYIVASAAAVTYGRSLIGSAVYILDSRYSFISVIFVSCVAMLTLLHFKRLQGRPALVITLLCSVYSFWVFQHFQAPLDALLQKRHAAFNKGHYEVFGWPMGQSNAVVERAVELGIYNPPCRPQPQCETNAAPAGQHLEQ